MKMPLNEHHVRLLLLLSAGVFACGGDDETSLPEGSAPGGNGSSESGTTESTEGNATGPTGGELAGSTDPTFWQDVAPILNQKCVACHNADGIAPFALDNFADAERRATLIADYTENRIMPPYLMEVGGECGEFDESAALTEQEIDTIGAWARGERLLGTPATMTPPSVPSLPEGLDVFTPEFTPAIEGGALAEFDEYRCFTVDMGLTEESFITAFEFEPGNREIVHHVIAMLVDPNAPSQIEGLSNTQAIARLREQEADPTREGWHCFGAAGEGVRVESSPAAWAPGSEPYMYPEGTGVRVQPDRQLVVQVHYNLAEADVRGQSDRTRVRLRLANSVRRQAGMLLNDAFLATLGNAQPDVLLPGDPAAKYSWTLTGAELGLPEGVPVEVISVGPHMHERGTKYTVEYGRDGEFECQGRVNRWDFNWQRHYDYVTPPVLDSNSQIRVSCEYDTSADTTAVLPGWGTRNEMCELTLIVAFPEGVVF